MTLSEHLRELRSRVLKSALAVVGLGVLGIVFYEPIFDFIVDGYQTACASADVDVCRINFSSIVDPFTVQLQIGLLTGIVLGCPVWIYQVWQFVTPGLYGNERRWAVLAIVAAVPLFLSGVVLAYWVMPKAAALLASFIPDGVAWLVNFKGYLSFVIRMVLAFGVAFLLPIFIILLNLVGVLSGQTLSNTRRWTIVGIFVFAAVATPTGDAITIFTLALPMWLLFEAAVVVCRIIDHRRARAEAAVSDDEASPLELDDVDSPEDAVSDPDDEPPDEGTAPPPRMGDVT